PRDDRSKEEFYRHLSRSVGGVELLEKRPDWRMFRKAGKDAYLFFNDNNDVLELIRRSACRIDCFIGIRDGCSDDGNYECVIKRSFFSNTLTLMPETGMDYITDHPELMLTRGGPGRSERRRGPAMNSSSETSG